MPAIEKKLHINTATVAKDVQQALLNADQAIGLLKSAATTVKTGGDFTPNIKASSELARDMWSALAAFLENRPLLGATETPALKNLASGLKDKIDGADAAEKAVLEAERGALLAKGNVEYKMLDLGAYNDQMLGQKLAEKADETGKPAMAEYFGQMMVVAPGTEGDRKTRADGAIKALRENEKPSVAGFLRNVKSNAERRVEITEAQGRPMRSIDEITLASQEKAAKNGYPKESLAGLIGMALQDVAHHGEIDMFAKHLLEMALKTDDVAKIADKGERVDRARDRAAYWVNNYGRNERELDAVWYASLRSHADTMKAE